MAATAGPGTLPEKATWYLVTNLPRPSSPREAASPHPAADLGEIVWIYGIRHWTGQSYKQVKGPLGPSATADRARTRREGGRRDATISALVAAGITCDKRLAPPFDHAAALVAGIVGQPPAATVASPR